jgi:hypothetical protein
MPINMAWTPYAARSAENAGGARPEAGNEPKGGGRRNPELGTGGRLEGGTSTGTGLVRCR